jgi:hypothetical protein
VSTTKGKRTEVKVEEQRRERVRAEARRRAVRRDAYRQIIPWRPKDY